MMGRRPTLQIQLVVCKSSLLSALLGLAFGHRDLLTLPSHYFLLEFLKERVDSNNPRSLGELKHSKEQTVASTDPETLHKVARLREGGGHFQYLL
jgi:hypothetical protein